MLTQPVQTEPSPWAHKAHLEILSPIDGEVNGEYTFHSQSKSGKIKIEVSWIERSQPCFWTSGKTSKMTTFLWLRWPRWCFGLWHGYQAIIYQAYEHPVAQSVPVSQRTSNSYVQNPSTGLRLKAWSSGWDQIPNTIEVIDTGRLLLWGIWRHQHPAERPT